MQKPPDESIVIKLQYAKDNHSNSSNQLLQQQQQHQDCLELNFTLASTGGSSTSALHQLRRLNNSAPQPFASENLGDSSSSSYSSSSSGKQSTTAAALPSGHMVKLQSAAQSTEVNATGGIADIQEIPLLCAVETLLDRVSRHRISKAMQRHQQRQEHQMSTKECIDALASEYKRGTMTFYSNEVEPIFPKAYNAIVKASDPNLFDTLLQLERSYAQTVNDCWLSHQRAILDSQNRYAFEMENGNAYMDPAALQAALSNQIEEIEIMQVTMESELDQLYLGQKQEYRDFIIKVYEELQKRSQEEAISLSLMHLQQSVDDDTISISASSTASGRFGRSDSVSGWNIAQDLGLMGGVGGKDYNDELQSSSRSILAMAVGKLDRSPSAEMLSTVEEVEFVESPARDSLVVPKKDPAVSGYIIELQEMGFTSAQAKAALNLTRNKMEEAIVLLIENPSKVDQHAQLTATLAASNSLAAMASLGAQSPRLTRSHPIIPRSVSSHSLGSLASRSNAQGGGGSGNNLQRPVSFMRMRSTSSNSSMDNHQSLTPPPIRSNNLSRSMSSVFTTANKNDNPTANNPSARSSQTKTMQRMTSFFGKAINALGLEDQDRNRRTPELDTSALSESFTIYLGTQVRTMYNLRLTVTKFENEYLLSNRSADEIGQEQDMAYRAQTASSLYMHDLSGVIVLLTAKDLVKYAQGKSANKDLIEQCKRSTEFHFDSIEKQLKSIQEKIPVDDQGRPVLNEGDFFITKHSNLPMIHVVFHLIVSDGSVRTDINSQSKLIAGYRSILKTCQRCDVHHLTIPLLLLPEDDVIDTPLITQHQQPHHHHGNRQSASTVSNPKRTSSSSTSSASASSNNNSNNLTTGIRTSTSSTSSYTNSTTTSTGPTITIEQFVLKRAELILKSTKGLIVENARAVKHGSEAGGIEKFARSLVFVLPRLKGHASNTTGAAGSTAVSNLVVVDGRTIVANGRATLVFNTVRDRLTEIFRAQ